MSDSPNESTYEARRELLHYIEPAVAAARRAWILGHDQLAIDVVSALSRQVDRDLDRMRMRSEEGA